MSEWQAAFITSTSRLVLPLRSIVVPTETVARMPEVARAKFRERQGVLHEATEPIVQRFKPNTEATMSMIVDGVANSIATRSTPIL